MILGGLLARCSSCGARRSKTTPIFAYRPSGQPAVALCPACYSDRVGSGSAPVWGSPGMRSGRSGHAVRVARLRARGWIALGGITFTAAICHDGLPGYILAGIVGFLFGAAGFKVQWVLLRKPNR
jgi:hypothetical protein